MTFLNYDWLGFAQNPTEAVRIIRDTSIFYLIVSLSYALSFLYMSWHCATPRKLKTIHYVGIFTWAFSGIVTIIQPFILAMIVNLIIMLLTINILFQLQFTSVLAAQMMLTSSKVSTDNKKALYAKTLLKKMNYTSTDVFGVTLLNEQILWLIIFYRAAIAFRASFGL